MLTVGVDTYISLEDAEILIEKTSLSSDPAYKKWTELTNADKEVLLRNSCRSIDNMKFNGRRAKVGQLLEFPRVDVRPCGLGVRIWVGQLFDNGLIEGDTTGDGGLSLVKEAQCVNAVMASLYNNEATNQVGVTIQGITSKKAGPIAETYGRRNDTNLSAGDAMAGIFSPKVYSLLTPWLAESRYTI